MQTYRQAYTHAYRHTHIHTQKYGAPRTDRKLPVMQCQQEHLVAWIPQLLEDLGQPVVHHHLLGLHRGCHGYQSPHVSITTHKFGRVKSVTHTHTRFLHTYIFQYIHYLCKNILSLYKYIRVKTTVPVVAGWDSVCGEVRRGCDSGVGREEGGGDEY